MIVNAYLDHVREHNYTGTFNQYIEIWMEEKLEEFRTTPPPQTSIGQLCSHC